MAVNKHIPMMAIWIVAIFNSLPCKAPIDELTLENALNALESSWKSIDFWLNVSTCVVVVGVAVECAVLAIEYRHELAAFRRGIVRPPDRPVASLFAVGFLGSGLVVLGILGEFREHISAGEVESAMRDISGCLVSIANEEAGKANARAATFEKEAVELRKQNIANERALEQEKTARLELQSKVAWRTVSDKQREILRKQLQSVRGRRVLVKWTGSDPERNSFAPQLINALSYAGLNAGPSGDNAYIEVPVMGESGPVALSIIASHRDADFAIALGRALVVASLAPYSQGITKFPVPTELRPKPTDFTIVVGMREHK